VARRREVIFNVVLLNRPEAVEGERTVTINVSEHGCFVFTVNDWRLESPAWMVVSEFDDKTPVELKVRWRRPWGTEGRVPGIGATFESMTAYQYVQLQSIL